MAGRRPWTAAERARAIRLRTHEGMTCKAIGEALGRPTNSVWHQVNSVAQPPKDARTVGEMRFTPEMLVEAKKALRAEIAAARREMAGALPYKGGW